MKPLKLNALSGKTLWTPSAVIDLARIVGEIKVKYPTATSKILWEKVANELCSSGFPVTASAAMQKFRLAKKNALISNFRSGPKNTGGSGDERDEDLEEVNQAFAANRMVNPLSTASNHASKRAATSSTVDPKKQRRSNFDRYEDMKAKELQQTDTLLNYLTNKQKYI